MTEKSDSERVLAEAAAEESSVAWDFLQFLRTSKKWWLVPLLLALAAIGLLAVVGASSVGPFVYPLF